MLEYKSNSVESTKQLGKCIGSILGGGEVIECTSDLGGGKTTLVSGIAEGFKSLDPVSSPSFTICNIYKRADLKQIAHFDFYRLSEPGIMRDELSEAIHDDNNIVIVEWADSVEDVLPESRIKINIQSLSDSRRLIKIDSLNKNIVSKIDQEIHKMEPEG